MKLQILDILSRKLIYMPLLNHLCPHVKELGHHTWKWRRRVLLLLTFQGRARVAIMSMPPGLRGMQQLHLNMYLNQEFPLATISG
jgi:hypothetical protein